MSKVESGLQLLARLIERPSIRDLDPILFSNGLTGNDMVLLSGESSSGKSMLTYSLIAKCVMPTSHGGLEARAIVISTDNNNSLRLLSNILRNRFDEEGADGNLDLHVEQCLSRIIILKTFSKEQLLFNFTKVGKLLFQMKDVALLVVDAIATFYWQDVVKLKATKKMDLYLKELIDKLKIQVRNHRIVSIVVKPGSFEVKINGSLVYSKLATMAYPEIEAVRDMVGYVKNGGQPQNLNSKQQPITDCSIQ